MTPQPITNRRSVLKATATGITGLAGFSSQAIAKGGGKEPLEDSESRVEFSIFVGLDGNPNNTDPNYAPDGKIDDHGDFLFPWGPAIAGASDTPGIGDALAFDTTVPQLTPGNQALHYVLRFVHGALLVNKPKPYVLTHTGTGRYRSRGATVNFDVGEASDVPPIFRPLLAQLGPGRYRAVVHDEVQLYEKGGAFDWSVSRAEFYKRQKGGIDHQLSLLYVVWDEDGPDNDSTTDRGQPGAPANLPSMVLPTANMMITNGKLNPGGR